MFLYKHADFKAFIGQVAQQKSINPAIIEKDYWVTLCLYHLANSEFKDEFIFKGGTSLSKAFNLINRFSEDVDLLFIHTNKNKRKRLRDAQEYLVHQGLNYYEEVGHDNRSGNESRTSCFNYEKIATTSLGSLLPFIKLEMGYRGGQTPNVTVHITSYLAEALVNAGLKPDAYNDLLPFEVKVLSPERTFVEKLFALHSAYELNEIEKRVRHYYDIYCLLSLSNVVSFIGTPDYIALKKDVYAFSKKNFRGSPLPDIHCLNASRFLSPAPDALTKIKTAHANSDLIFGDKPLLEEIFKRIDSIKVKL